MTLTQRVMNDISKFVSSEEEEEKKTFLFLGVYDAGKVMWHIGAREFIDIQVVGSLELAEYGMVV